MRSRIRPTFDIERLNSCIGSAKYAGTVKAEVEEAKRLKVVGTPTFLIGRIENDEVDGEILLGGTPAAITKALLKYGCKLDYGLIRYTYPDR